MTPHPPAVHAPSKRALIPAFQVMEISRLAREAEAAGRDIKHLEVGQPATPAPRAVLDAAHKALDSNLLGYTDAIGIPELRQAIADWYVTTDGVAVAPDNVVVTTGASGSCLLAFMALWDPGQRVGVLEPGYPCYRNDLEALGIEVVRIPVGPETNYRPNAELLAAAGPLDGLVLASPSNPTGTVLSEEDLAQILDWADANGASLVVDEIYHGITYGCSTKTVLAQLGERPRSQPPVLVFNSFSKYFSMTGWRLGWIVAPDSLITPLERLAQNLTIAPPTLSQLAGIEAFNGVPECEANIDRYRTNRRVVLDGLNQAGLVDLAPSDGGFYVWCDVRAILDSDCATSVELCAKWLADIDVAVTPGTDFDRERGDHFVRFSYAGSTQDMNEAMDRIAGWIEQRRAS